MHVPRKRMKVDNCEWWHWEHCTILSIPMVKRRRTWPKVSTTMAFLFLEKAAKTILDEDLFRLLLLYLPYLAEPKVILFLISICSNMLDHDTSRINHVWLHIADDVSFRLWTSGGQSFPLRAGQSDRWSEYLWESKDYPPLFARSVRRRFVLLNELQVLWTSCNLFDVDRVKEELCSSLFFYKLTRLSEQYANTDEEFLRETCYILVVLITTGKTVAPSFHASLPVFVSVQIARLNTYWPRKSSICLTTVCPG